MHSYRLHMSCLHHQSRNPSVPVLSVCADRDTLQIQMPLDLYPFLFSYFFFSPNILSNSSFTILLESNQAVVSGKNSLDFSKSSLFPLSTFFFIILNSSRLTFSDFRAMMRNIRFTDSTRSG